MNSNTDQDAMGRREFLLIAGGSLASLSLAGCVRLKTTPPPTEGEQLIFPFSRYPELQNVGGVATAGPVRIGRYKGNIFVRRDSADTALVLGARCRHLGCDVNWEAGENEFVCPCHDSHYGPAGELTKGTRPQGPL